MPIVWRDQMAVGVKSVDEDHRGLIDIINQFEAAVRADPSLKGTGEGTVRSLLGRLQTYVREHFAREERMQASAVYPGLAENRAEHQRLTAELEALVSRFTAGGRAEKPLTGEEMVSFLTHWLIDHILKCDLKMKGFRFPAGQW